MGSLNKKETIRRMLDLGCVEDIDYSFTGHRNEFNLFETCDHTDCDPNYETDIMM
jgi:hypothetical protein